MKQLIILRHGKPEPTSWNDDDFSRKLTDFGKNSLLGTAKYFQQQNCNIDTILTSDAVRAMETTEIIAKQLKIREDRIIVNDRLYLASKYTILKHIEKLNDESQVVLLVGHNPGITDLINQFAVRLDYLPTSSAVCFSIDADSWLEIRTAIKKFEWIFLR